jgi:hypothetical protein
MFFDFQNFLKIETTGSLIFKFLKNGKTEIVSLKNNNNNNWTTLVYNMLSSILDT